jgi:hypothetical protein
MTLCSTLGRSDPRRALNASVKETKASMGHEPVEWHDDVTMANAVSAVGPRTGVVVALLSAIALLPIALVPARNPHQAAGKPPPLQLLEPPVLPADLLSGPKDPANDPELAEIYATDQAERATPPAAGAVDQWTALREHDTSRRARVAAIVASGRARTGADWYAAAMVYQHGEALDDYARARDYAVAAVLRGDRRGSWLAAAAWDRWLVHAGYPQRFGTQARCDVIDGGQRCHLEPYDPSTTDADRSRWNVPPLREMLRRYEAQ